MFSKKARISIVVIGHIDSGKSTTIGHLLFKCGVFSENTVDKLLKEIKACKKSSRCYA